MAATDRTLFDRICQCFDNHFNYTCTEDTKAPFQQSPFPLKLEFEWELYLVPPLVGKDLIEIESRHNGSLYKWASALQYASQQTRVDLGYGVMQLS
eukprot:11947075-Ditylum_brightwellii.AAC.1